MIRFLVFVFLPLSIFAQKPAIYFSSDKYIPSPANDSIADALVKALKSCPGARVMLTGYTDNTSTVAHNMSLSLNRARQVFKILTGRQIDSSRISYLGLGEFNPCADNNSESGKQKNRRVECELVNYQACKCADRRGSMNPEFQKVFHTHSKKIIIKLYDGMEVDKDVITLKVNDRVIVSHFEVTALKKTFQVDSLRFGRNIMEFIAISQGTIGAATPNMVFDDGVNKLTYMISATYREPAKILVIVEN